MKTRYYLVDAFTDNAFQGNPAAIVLCESESIINQAAGKLAKEFNLSETAFLSSSSSMSSASSLSSSFESGSCFSLRWFTPTKEVQLCGHATLAAAHVLINELKNPNPEIRFETLSGTLVVRSSMDESGHVLLRLAFPLNPFVILGTYVSLAKPIQELIGCFLSNKEEEEKDKAKVSSVHEVFYSEKTGKLFVRLADGDESVRQLRLLALSECSSKLLKIDQSSLSSNRKVSGISISVYSPSSGRDFVSRYMSPWNGIPEDPVNGSSHTTLAPYYSSFLKKDTVIGEMASSRGGVLICNVMKKEELVELCGKCVTIAEGVLRNVM